jgi:hypothetical protein
MTEIIAGVHIPDSALVKEATEQVVIPPTS